MERGVSGRTSPQIKVEVAAMTRGFKSETSLEKLC